MPSFSFNELSTGKLKMTGDSWFEVQFRKFQIWFLNKTRWPLIFMHGRGVFNYKYGLIPYRVPITVVGKIFPDLLAIDSKYWLKNKQISILFLSFSWQANSS